MTTYAANTPLVVACIRMQSQRLRVRIIHQLKMMPVMNPTSQKEPCSMAKRAATNQKAWGAYAPSGTRVKSFESISQRISQPRQKSSSRIGTATTLIAMRKKRNTASFFELGGV